MDRRRLLVLPAVFLSLVLLAPAIAQGRVNGPGRTFHVSPSGSDSNPGTESQPWATISRGVASLEPGDVLIVHGGTYHEVIVINVSGTPEAPIEI
ncbi:MAG TPA: DUF1565 domain-containing protein, partial [Candidatus Korarchaeota archaeon]|nr:DUF1565 domain-containing protein [Candidatus Korarchaeota archaeon]